MLVVAALVVVPSSCMTTAQIHFLLRRDIAHGIIARRICRRKLLVSSFVWNKRVSA